MSEPAGSRWSPTSSINGRPGDGPALFWGRSKGVVPSGNLIEQVGPALHHLNALGPVLGAVVGAGDLVFLDVGELAINDAEVEAQLLLDVGYGQGAEAVTSHAPIEAHALDGHVHGVVADEAGGGALALKDIAVGAADCVLGLEQRCS